MNALVRAFASLAVVAAVPCVLVAQAGAVREPAPYLEAAMKWPTYFGVLTEEFPDVWKRARIVAERYAGHLVVDSDSEITAVRPSSDQRGARSLRVTCTPTFGGWRIGVEVIPERSGENADADRLAHVVAYAIASGSPVPPELLEL
jgi:hypothetical protein